MKSLSTNLETVQTKRVKSTSWTLQELKQFFKKARRIYTSQLLDIKVAPQQTPEGHLLIVAPKKIGTAPQRNLFKRRIKAIFYENKLSAQGLDWAVFAKPGITHIPFSELKAILLSLCSKKSSN